jgi:hypothetical protein
MNGNTRDTAIEKLFDCLDDGQKHERLLSYVRYPKTKELSTGNAPRVSCRYSCVECICDFKDAVKCIDESVDLRAFGCQKVAKLVS